MKNSITIGNRISLSGIDINTDNSSNRPKQYRYDHISNEPESGIEVENIEVPSDYYINNPNKFTDDSDDKLDEMVSSFLESYKDEIEGRKEPITMHRVFVIFLIVLFVVLSVLLLIN